MRQCRGAQYLQDGDGGLLLHLGPAPRFLRARGVPVMQWLC
jgi:hypothetical protein